MHYLLKRKKKGALSAKAFLNSVINTKANNIVVAWKRQMLIKGTEILENTIEHGWKNNDGKNECRQKSEVGLGLWTLFKCACTEIASNVG